MIQFQVMFVMENGAESSAMYFAEDIKEATDLFREDFGGLAIDCIEAIVEDYDEHCDYNDALDGDFDSAMASAGSGMDEDYGYASEVL
jgi:hypothetical protein